MPSIQGRIEAVTFIKSGPRKDGRGNWSMFKVIINGQEHTGFGDTWQKDIGKEGTWEYKEKPWTDRSGMQRIDRTLESPRAAGGFGAQKLEAIEKKLDEVLSILKRGPVTTSQEMPVETPPVSGDEINVDDIPF